MYSLWDNFLERKRSDLSVSLMFHRKFGFEKGINIITFILMIELWLVEEKKLLEFASLCAYQFSLFLPNSFTLGSMVIWHLLTPLYQKNSELSGYFYLLP